MVNLVKKYYQNKEFAVITPYDPQRNEIEKALKAEDLPWENRVFNVDSFQGENQFFYSICAVPESFLTVIRQRARLHHRIASSY